MSELTWQAPFPDPVVRNEDEEFWNSVQSRRMAIQHCGHCGTARYPAAAVCPHCLSDEVQWRPISGRASLVSWCTFHRQYLEAYPPPHTVAAGRLAEGPLFLAMLIGPRPEDGQSGMPLEIVYVTDPSGRALPAFRAARTSPQDNRP